MCVCLQTRDVRKPVLSQYKDISCFLWEMMVYFLVSWWLHTNITAKLLTSIDTGQYLLKESKWQLYFWCVTPRYNHASLTRLHLSGFTVKEIVLNKGSCNCEFEDLCCCWKQMQISFRVDCFESAVLDEWEINASNCLVLSSFVPQSELWRSLQCW